MDINISSQIVVQTAAQWAVDATVYSNKRILVTSDVYYGSTDQRKFKIADGVQTWSNLDYAPLSQTIAQVLDNGNLMQNGTYILNQSSQSGFYVDDEYSAIVGLNAPFTGNESVSIQPNKATLKGGTGKAVTVLSSLLEVAHTTQVNITTPIINLPNSTASRIVETDASKNLTYAAKNTAYNLDLGTTAGTVTEGNDSRLTNSRIQSIYADITPFTSATTGADELAQSKLIPAGTLTTNDFFDVYNWVSKTGTAGNKTTKVWINTSATLAGATQIAQFENTTAAGSQLFFRTFAIKSNTSIRGLTTGTALAPGYISVATLGADIAIPTLASNVYVMTSVSRVSGADTHISEALKIVPQKAV